MRVVCSVEELLTRSSIVVVTTFTKEMRTFITFSLINLNI